MGLSRVLAHRLTGPASDSEQIMLPHEGPKNRRTSLPLPPEGLEIANHIDIKSIETCCCYTPGVVGTLAILAMAIGCINRNCPDVVAYLGAQTSAAQLHQQPARFGLYRRSYSNAEAN